MISDTNALSAAAEEHRTVIQILSTAQVVALPVIVIGEYRYGIVQSRHKARYRLWLDGLINEKEVASGLMSKIEKAETQQQRRRHGSCRRPQPGLNRVFSRRQNRNG